jgi:hypothetical protein
LKEVGTKAEVFGLKKLEAVHLYRDFKAGLVEVDNAKFFAGRRPKESAHAIAAVFEAIFNDVPLVEHAFVYIKQPHTFIDFVVFDFDA